MICILKLNKERKKMQNRESRRIACKIKWQDKQFLRIFKFSILFIVINFDTLSPQRAQMSFICVLRGWFQLPLPPRPTPPARSRTPLCGGRQRFLNGIYMKLYKPKAFELNENSQQHILWAQQHMSNPHRLCSGFSFRT